MSNNNQVPSSDLGGDYSPASGSSDGILLATVLFLFLLVVLAAVFYFYAKTALGTYTGHLLNYYAQPRVVGTSTQNMPAGSDGLDSAVLRSLPVMVFGAKEFADRLECAVCLSDVSIGEKVRVLPKCNHRFHVDCIDTWFRSHSTCPLCRSPVDTDDLEHTQQPNADSVQARSLNAVAREHYVAGTPVLPTNMSFWGTQHDAAANSVPEATSSSNGAGSRKRNDLGTLVIDIPRQTTEIGAPTSPGSPLPTSVMPVPEETKSPGSASFWSLKRLLSRGKQLVGPSGSPRVSDVEQGNAVHTPKTPKSFIRD